MTTQTNARIETMAFSDGEQRQFHIGTNLVGLNFEAVHFMGASVKFLESHGEINLYEVDFSGINPRKILWKNGSKMGLKSYSNPNSTDPTIYLWKVDPAIGVIDVKETYRRRYKKDEASFFEGWKRA